MKANTPDWLNAVGTLVVPGYRYEDGERRSHLEHCSATLVANNLILSGWHCLEFYGDLSRDIEFALPGSGAPQVRTARGRGRWWWHGCGLGTTAPEPAY